MEMKVIEEKENVFFNRKEVKIEIAHPKLPTPSKQDFLKELASKYSVPEENVVIDYIFTKKGLGSSTVKAKIYKEKPKLKGGKTEAQISETK